MSGPKSIAKNTSGFTLALVAQKIIAFVYFTLLAQLLGAEKLGTYVFVLSFVAMFSLLVDFGTNHYITREVAKYPQRAQNLFSTVLGFKIIAALLALAVFWLVVGLLDYDPFVAQLLYVAWGVLVLETIALTTYAVMRGFQNLSYESLMTVVVHAVILLFGYTIATTTGSLVHLIIIVIGAYSINVIYGLAVLWKKFNIQLRVTFEKERLQKLFVTVLPFALAAGFARIYGAFDQVMLSKLAHPAELGYYAVAYKLTFALQFIPMAFTAAVYPVFSSKIGTAKGYTEELFSKVSSLLMTLAAPISIVVILFCPSIIMLLYGSEYQNSILPLQLLIASLPFLFINFPIGSLLNAAGKQKLQTRNIGLALILNIIANTLFIPLFAASGAALASTLSTVALTLFGFYTLLAHLQVPLKVFAADMTKLLFISAGFVGVIMLLQFFTDVHWIGLLVIALALYGLVVTSTRLVSKDIITRFLANKQYE